MALHGHIAGGGLHAATPTGFCRLIPSMLGSGKRGLKRNLSDYKKNAINPESNKSLQVNLEIAQFRMKVPRLPCNELRKTTKFLTTVED